MHPKYTDVSYYDRDYFLRPIQAPEMVESSLNPLMGNTTNTPYLKEIKNRLFDYKNPYLQAKCSP